MLKRILGIMAVLVAASFASAQASQVYDYSFGDSSSLPEDGGEFLSVGYDLGSSLTADSAASATSSSAAEYGSYYNTTGGYWWFIGGNFWNWNGGIDNWFGSDPRPETYVSEPAGIVAVSLVALGGLMAWRRRQQRRAA